MPATLAPHAADALLFDLGRVVLDIDFDRTVAAWARDAGCSPAELRGRWTADDAYHRHERGEIDDAAFFAILRDQLGVALSDAQWLAGWNAIFVGEMPGIAPLLARAAARLPLYALSNTNPAHVVHFSQAYADLLGHFRRVFVSSAIGMRKPEPAAYDHVIAEIGAKPERIVFFDDLIANVEAARARGLIAVQVQSSADVARALDALGL
ncbi:putative hydrolase of the HAD superfamily [Rhodopseudomonas rhenobacensis]|uniref:Putative hydrolase of the HAD superfamily n=1 Tax=Rhodopseudomonas rhenobacensis TaxID=87461 RepID=A0A7W8DXK4_9BRAD|nr:HAD-IA family hydrolase [Rhodopseudomonas rhenobacensis]MBB5046324.1 putative hydrolase of the HAD superfamily [Rhodopseudomonas rhenobacensis]